MFKDPGKLCVISIFTMVVLLAGCSASDKISTDINVEEKPLSSGSVKNRPTDAEDASVKGAASGKKNFAIKVISVSKKNIKLKLMNKGSQDIRYTKLFRLKKYEKGKWKKIEFGRNAKFPKSLYILEANSSCVEKVTWKPFFDSQLSPGRYQIEWPIEDTFYGKVFTITEELSSPFSQIYGKWKVTKPIGTGYIYSDSIPEKAYVGGILTIREDYIESKMSRKILSGKLNNPTYIARYQTEDEFFSWAYANYDSFGFTSGDKVPLIRVKDGKKDWDAFGNIIWIKDKNHIVLFGSPYFLAKRVEE